MVTAVNAAMDVSNVNVNVTHIRVVNMATASLVSSVVVTASEASVVMVPISVSTVADKICFTNLTKSIKKKEGSVLFPFLFECKYVYDSARVVLCSFKAYG